MIKKNKDNSTPEVNSSSMADIAFLLLIFFLVTTTITSDKGVNMLLPPANAEDVKVELSPSNVFVVLINSQDKLLVEGTPFKIDDLRKETKLFLNNYGGRPSYSESPEKAVVAIKADRGTTYERYLTVLNEVKAAYNELRAEHIGISKEEFINLDIDKNKQHAKWFISAKEKYPYRVSIAEPQSSGGQ